MLFLNFKGIFKHSEICQTLVELPLQVVWTLTFSKMELSVIFGLGWGGGE